MPSKHTTYDKSDNIIRQFYATWDTLYSNHLTQAKTLISGNLFSIVDIKYDWWGNIIQKTFPANAAGQRLTYTYTYGGKSTFNQYLTQITDSYGYTSTLGNYNYKYGVPCKITDENNNVMLTSLDNFGRVISITGPNEYKDGAAIQQYTMQFEYHPQMITKDGLGKVLTAPYAITRHWDGTQTDADKNLETVNFGDGFGRSEQVKKEGMIGTSKVMLVSGRAKYDAFGRVKAAYYPVTETDNSLRYIFNAAFDSTDSHLPSTRTSYDVLDRVLMTKLPDGTSTQMSYTIEDGKLKTTVTDAIGGKQATYTNGSGQTVKTVQMPDNGPIITLFHYDAINQLDSVTDAKGKKTISVYDMAGRRTQVTHPASGITNFGYDAAGNVLWQYTANKDSIKYGYEFNRVKTINYPRHPENNVIYTYGAYRASDNCAGRPVSIEDGSGKQVFKYGKQGEVTEVKRTLVIPNQAVATYTTKTSYDSWNRLQNMTYPDGEVVNYKYNTGGLLNSVINSNNYSYVSNINYDKFEQRTYLKYGNGAETNYAYNDSNRTLTGLSVKNTLLGVTQTLMNNQYKYDRVKNIVSVINSGMAISSANTMGGTIGGRMEHTYQYDNLYRLKEAHGDFKDNQSKTAHYDLYMGYDNMHNITSKVQHIWQTGVQFAGTLQAGYNLGYTYADNSQQIANIADSTYRTEGTGASTPEYKISRFSYDANGNLLIINTGTQSGDKLYTTNNRKMLWDEENRLLALNDNGFVSNYWYDAAGERTVKESGNVEGVQVNGIVSAGRTGTTKFTAYISPYLVVSNGGNYTKHIYIGGQRITSKVSNSGIFSTSPVNTTDLQAKFTAQTAKIKERYDSLGIIYKGTPQSGGLITSSPDTTTSSYFYHSDHLGSSSLITDKSGTIVQHLEYVPFGETFIDERKSQSSWTTPYLFSGKERDEETGLLYFGARYQDSKYGIWYSVDPKAEKYPNVSSYVYCMDNPVIYIDPDGRLILGFKSGMSMNVSYQVLGSGKLTPNYSLTNGNNQVRSIYPNNPPSVSISKGNFEYEANIPDVVTFNGYPTTPFNETKSNNDLLPEMIERGNNIDATGGAAQGACKALAGFVNSSTKNQYLDIVNIDKAFGMAYSAVMKNNDAISDRFKNENWSGDFKNAVLQGKIDIRNFKADIMNYMVDGNMNMDNFKLKGYSKDFNTYKNAVYQMGEQILNSSKLNSNVPQQNTSTNNIKNAIIYTLGR